MKTNRHAIIVILVYSTVLFFITGVEIVSARNYTATLETELNTLETKIQAMNDVINELESKVSTNSGTITRNKATTDANSVMILDNQANKLSHEQLNLMINDLVDLILDSMEE